MPTNPIGTAGGEGKAMGGGNGSGSTGGAGLKSPSSYILGGGGSGSSMHPSVDRNGYYVSPYPREDYLKYISYTDFCTYYDYYKRQTVFQRQGIDGDWYVAEAHSTNNAFIVVLRQLQKTATPYYHPELFDSRHVRYRHNPVLDKWTDYRQRIMGNISDKMSVPSEMGFGFDMGAPDKKVVPKPVAPKVPVEYKDEKGNIKFK